MEKYKALYEKAKEALNKIYNPIGWMQNDAEKRGLRLDGMWAIKLAEDPNYLRKIANTALFELSTLEQEPEEEMYLKESVMKAINDEPELPGEMPDEIYYSFKDDKGALAELLRITVKETKKGIRNRLLEIK